MNHSDISQNSAMPIDSHLSQTELCDVCCGKDYEDFYIVFNALYRVVIGDVFYQRQECISEEFDLDPMHVSQRKQEDFNTSQEKLQLFRQQVSCQTLIDLISSPRFDLLLREIFKSKYIRVQDTTCKHQELAMNFIKTFELKNDENLENPDLQRKKYLKNIEKLDLLYNRVKQLKSEIETYYHDMDDLSDRIVQRLINNHSYFANKKIEEADEDDENSDNEASDYFDSYESKKLANNSESINGSNSTRVGSEGGSSNCDKSVQEMTPVIAQGHRQKKSKTATFKSKLPKRATDVLKNWFLSNIQNPYPSHEAKELLSKMTGLTRKQIQNWFTNSRKRFLEPLKKKIEGQKQDKDVIMSTENLFTPESLSQADEIETNLQPMSVEPSIPQQSPRKLISFGPSFQTIGENSLAKNLDIQRFSEQINPQGQGHSLVYPAVLPQTNMPTKSNFIVVPWVMSQPIYAYRPSYPNLLPISAPQLIPFQQNSFVGNYPIIDNATLMNGQYMLPLQQNMIDVNSLMKPSINNSFNTINNNPYAYLNQQQEANMQPLFLNQGIPFINRMPQYGIQSNGNLEKMMYTTDIQESLKKRSSGVYHPKPELIESYYQGTKFLHTEQIPQTSIN
jgi:hypothetical protein